MYLVFRQTVNLNLLSECIRVCLVSCVSVFQKSIYFLLCVLYWPFLPHPYLHYKSLKRTVNKFQMFFNFSYLQSKEYIDWIPLCMSNIKNNKTMAWIYGLLYQKKWMTFRYGREHFKIMNRLNLSFQTMGFPVTHQLSFYHC